MGRGRAMSSFTTPLIVKVLDSGSSYELQEGFSYYRADKDSKLPDIEVPAGFITDFASVPRIFWSILPPFGRYTKSAVLHDFLCEEWKKGKNTRKKADSIFLESMKAVGVKRLTRVLLYLGVRIYAILKGYK